ncbi:MAG: adenosylhomocysteinase [Desertimonas sp.]
MSTVEGRGAIDFARSFMPALDAAQAVAADSGALRGRRVGVALPLEPKTACLAEALAAVGAQVAVLGNDWSTKPGVVGALRDAGLDVFADPDGSDGRLAELVDRFIDTGIEYLADDGAGITRRLHADRRDQLTWLRGVAEETTSGVRPLRTMAAEGALEVPVVAVNDARTKLLFDNVYGSGQSVVMATLDATNMQMGGTRVVVAGYGRVGRGIALMARGLGARVTVTEIDPVGALAAHHDGHDVGRLADAVADADFVFTASGIGHTLTAEHVAAMRDGAVIAVGGAGRPEFDPAGLSLGEEIRPHVRPVEVGPEVTVFVVAAGRCANTTAGEGNPIEAMDLSLALQLRALDHLASSGLEVGVHLLPSHIDDEVAASQLRAVGIVLDTPSDAQRRWAASR